jgi:CheY-like chemotaxis protein
MRNRICAFRHLRHAAAIPLLPKNPIDAVPLPGLHPFARKVAFAMPNDVLIVEDDAIIAIDFEATIMELGIQSVRTAAHASEALAMIAERAPDFALLDVGLGDDTSFVVADRLDALKIPYAFVTGYRADVALASRFAGKPVLNKPCLREELEAALRGSPEPAE